MRTQLWLNLLRGHLDWTATGTGGQQLFKNSLKRQIYPGTRPGFALEKHSPPVNKVAINHLSTGDLNHGSKPHYPILSKLISGYFLTEAFYTIGIELFSKFG